MKYSIKGDPPIDSLPHRIRLSNTKTKTDNTTFTDSDLVSAGITTVADPPTYNSNTHKLVWDRDNIQWAVVELSDHELIFLESKKWEGIRDKRDKLLESMDVRVFRYLREERLGITTHTVDISDLDRYVQELRDIPQTYSNADDVVWPKEGDQIESDKLDGID